MKSLRILSLESLLFFLAALRKARQGISSNIGFILVIIDVEMVTRELLGLPDLERAQASCIYKLAKVVVIYENENLIFIAF